MPNWSPPTRHVVVLDHLQRPRIVLQFTDTLAQRGALESVLNEVALERGFPWQPHDTCWTQKNRVVRQNLIIRSEGALEDLCGFRRFWLEARTDYYFSSLCTIRPRLLSLTWCTSSTARNSRETSLPARCSSMYLAVSSGLRMVV
jgi:hypothetical protein